MFGNRKLGSTDSILKTYFGDVIQQEGTVMVTVSYIGQNNTMKLHCERKMSGTVWKRLAKTH